MAEPTFYRCNTCGNVLVTINDSGVNPVCCGTKMEPIAANSTDAAQEKHVPVVEQLHGGHAIKVTVGSVIHPMTEEHYIEWIALVAEDRVEIHYLKPGQEPTTTFGGVQHGTAYAFCNLHGLWKAAF